MTATRRNAKRIGNRSSVPCVVLNTSTKAAAEIDNMSTSECAMYYTWKDNMAKWGGHVVFICCCKTLTKPTLTRSTRLCAVHNDHGASSPLIQLLLCHTSTILSTIPFLFCTMATLNRRPLANRPIQACSPLKSMRTVSGSKRARSPDIFDLNIAKPTSKRIKSVDASSAIAIRDSSRDKKHLEREQQKAEFRDKYTRAFPGFTFHFDDESVGAAVSEGYKAKVELLGAVCAFCSFEFLLFNLHHPRRPILFSLTQSLISSQIGHCPKPIPQPTKRTIPKQPTTVC
jgi:hypothetical protein